MGGKIYVHAAPLWTDLPARRIYIGVDGTARKVKKAYIGANNVAREVFCNQEELVYYAGLAQPLNVPRNATAALSTGTISVAVGGREAATIAGGLEADGKTSYAHTTYFRNLSKTENNGYYLRRNLMAAAATPEFNLFAGGRINGSYPTDEVVVVSSSGFFHDVRLNLGNKKAGAGGGSVGGYAVFAGGFYSEGSPGTYLNYADANAFDGNLQAHVVGKLSQARGHMASTQTPQYAVFAGGRYGWGDIPSANVDAYDALLTSIKVAPLSIARYSTEAAVAGDHVLVAGGYGTAGMTDVIDVYDKNMVKGTPLHLRAPCYSLSATSIGGMAVFSGGWWAVGYPYVLSHALDVFTGDLVRHEFSMQAPRSGHAAVAVGDYLLISGGYDQDMTKTGRTEVYIVNGEAK